MPGQDLPRTNTGPCLGMPPVVRLGAVSNLLLGMWVRIHIAPGTGPPKRELDLQGPGYMWAGHPDKNKEAGSEAESQGTL